MVIQNSEEENKKEKKNLLKFGFQINVLFFRAFFLVNSERWYVIYYLHINFL